MLQTVRWYLANPTWVENVTTGAYRHWLDMHYKS
jgi:dTDP-glucose 4,6-dehydratase